MGALGFTFDQRTVPAYLPAATTGTVVVKAPYTPTNYPSTLPGVPFGSGTIAGVSINTAATGSLTLTETSVTPNKTLAIIDTSTLRSVILFNLQFGGLSVTKVGAADVTILFN
jgi:hypothetical protein